MKITRTTSSRIFGLALPWALFFLAFRLEVSGQLADKTSCQDSNGVAEFASGEISSDADLSTFWIEVNCKRVPKTSTDYVVMLEVPKDFRIEDIRVSVNDNRRREGVCWWLNKDEQKVRQFIAKYKEWMAAAHQNKVTSVTKEVGTNGHVDAFFTVDKSGATEFRFTGQPYPAIRGRLDESNLKVVEFMLDSTDMQNARGEVVKRVQEHRAEETRKRDLFR